MFVQRDNSNESYICLKFSYRLKCILHVFNVLLHDFSHFEYIG